MRGSSLPTLLVFILFAIESVTHGSLQRQPSCLAPPGDLHAQEVKKASEMRLLLDQLRSEKKSPREIGQRMTEEIRIVFQQVLKRAEEKTLAKRPINARYAVYLFGSAGRVDEWVFGLGSDIDFALIPSDEASKEYTAILSLEIRNELSAIGFESYRFLNAMPATPEELLAISEKNTTVKTQLLDFRWITGDSHVDRRVQEILTNLSDDLDLLRYFLDEQIPNRLKNRPTTPKELMRLIQMFTWSARVIYPIKTKGPTDVSQMLAFLHKVHVLSVQGEAERLSQIYWRTYDRRLRHEIEKRLSEGDFGKDVEDTVKIIREGLKGLIFLRNLIEQGESWESWGRPRRGHPSATNLASFL